MALTLDTDDHDALEGFLTFVLDAYNNGEVRQDQAIAAIAHVFTAAAIDNDDEVQKWLDPRTWADWLGGLKD